MDTLAGRRRAHRTIKCTQTYSEYTHDVNMYKKPPQHNISLNEFEEFALERLQLMRILEEASAKGHKQFSEDWKKYIKEELAKVGLKKYIRLMSGYCGQTEQDIQARKADHVSHFILKLAYCRSEDLRRWFLSRELEWFKLRFINQSFQGVTHFLQLNNLTYVPITAEVKEKLKSDLMMCTTGIYERDFHAVEFYRVPFAEVLLLVKSRNVFLEKGYAYIPTRDLIVSIQAQFRAALSESLSIYNQRLPNVDDDRLNTLLGNLHNVHTGKTYVIEDNKDGINPANVDAYSKQHFPLCMRHLYNSLKTNHHLKHNGRLHFILFLKGIGVSYEDALEFWRSELTKNPKIDDNKFAKEYSYIVRHSYGKVGNMTNYTPFSCIKIIQNNPGPGQEHGCPFRHWDANILKQKLGEYGLGSQNLNSVMELVKEGHYQIACSKYFECSQGQASTNIISHPNQYFTESMNIMKEKQGTKKN